MKDRICEKCKSNKGGFDTCVNNRSILVCGNCGFVFREKEADEK